MKAGQAACVFTVPSSDYFLRKFELGSDLNQPHNFVLINGLSIPSLIIDETNIQGSKLKYEQKLSWIKTNSTSPADLSDRWRESNETVVVISSSTVNLQIEFLNKDFNLRGT